VIKVRHIGITVLNLENMLNFYQHLLGFASSRIALESGEYIDNFSNLKGVKVTTAKLSNSFGDVMIELLKYHSHETSCSFKNINDGGISHFAITVEDIMSIYKSLKKEGIHFNCEPQKSPDGGALVTFCRDPEGNLIEVVEVLS
jgi:catechol 2,3-dioxygenase-like lactoylglutathione lyase family enzyme